MMNEFLAKLTDLDQAEVNERQMEAEDLLLPVGAYRNIGKMWDSSVHFCDDNRLVIRSFIPDHTWPVMMVTLAQLLQPAEQARVRLVVYVTQFLNKDSPTVACMAVGRMSFPELLRQVKIPRH